MRNRLWLASICVCLAMLVPGEAGAGFRDKFKDVRLDESFIARLSPRDHRNSRGERLTTIAQIIRQDRANYHRFQRRDTEDTGDGVFHEIGNRQILETLVDRASEENGLVEQIVVHETPLVRIDIYRGYEFDGSIVMFVVVNILQR